MFKKTCQRLLFSRNTTSINSVLYEHIFYIINQPEVFVVSVVGMEVSDVLVVVEALKIKINLKKSISTQHSVEK